MLREQRYEVLGYFIEKKTKEEYARERFKKKYNYVPDKTKGGNDPYHGTITDDKGKKHRVDMGKSKTVENSDNGQTVKQPRQTGAMIAGDKSKHGEIVVDSGYFKLKNDKRRKAIMDHELAHERLHSMQKGDHTDVSAITKKSIRSNVRSALNLNGMDTSEKTVDEVCRAILQNNELSKYYDNEGKLTDKQKLRNEIIKICEKKYNKNIPHLNTAEVEADLSSEQKNKKGDLKKGLHEYSKMMAKKNYDITIDTLCEQLNLPKKTALEFVRQQYEAERKKGKNLKKNPTEKDLKDFLNKIGNKIMSADLKNRSKALNDKELMQKAKKFHKS